MSCQLQTDLIQPVQMSSLSCVEQDIFDRYRPVALAVAFKKKSMTKLLKADWFTRLLNEAGLVIDQASPQSVSDTLNLAINECVGISGHELDEALPALASLSSSLGLNATEKLILVFLVNLKDDRQFWFDLNVELDELPRDMVAPLLADILQIDPYQAHLALKAGGRLFKSGVLEHRMCGRLQSLPLSAFFAPTGEISIHMFRSKSAWNDFFSSKFERLEYTNIGVDFSHLAEEVSLIENCLSEAVINRNKGMHVLLYGPPGTGKTTLARELAYRLNFELFEVGKDRSNFRETDGELRFGVYQLGQQLGGAKTNCLVLFDELEDLLPSAVESLRGGEGRLHKGWICNSLEKSNIPTIWTSNSLSGIDPAILRRFTFSLEVPVPPKRLRRKIMDDLLADFGLSSEWMERTASLRNLTPAMTRQMSDLAQSLNAKAGKLEAALDLWLAGHLKALGAAPLPLIKATPDFMCELMNTDMEPNNIIEGLKESGEARLCLFGPPGTGKTAFAKYLAERLDVEAHVKRASDIRSMWVGETERNIARMFKEASRDGAVLILDEADSFLSGRSGRQQGWQMNEVSEFLVQLENFQGFFCATTNRFEDLDPAFIRRFDLKIELDYLTGDQRVMMFKSILRKTGVRACLGAPIRRELNRLGQLTPGDFITAQRGMCFSQQECNQENLFSALVHEVECKTASQGRPIGFRTTG